MIRRHRALVIPFAAVTLSVSLLAGPQGKIDFHRTIYVTATTQSGADVSDLTGADLTVKEGGKARQILRAEPSRARLKIALAVDELLAADSVIRQAAVRFVQQTHDSGDLALYLIGRRNEKRVDYTADLGPFIKAINAFPNRPQYPGDSRRVALRGGQGPALPRRTTRDRRAHARDSSGEQRHGRWPPQPVARHWHDALRRDPGGRREVRRGPCRSRR